jgi:lipoate-protein ligase A
MSEVPVYEAVVSLCVERTAGRNVRIRSDRSETFGRGTISIEKVFGLAIRRTGGGTYVSTYLRAKARKNKVIRSQSGTISVGTQGKPQANDELTVDRPFSLTCFDQ